MDYELVRTPVNNPFRLRCPRCDEKFKLCESFKEHFAMQHCRGQTFFQCERCKNRFASMVMLFHHLEECNPEGFQYKIRNGNPREEYRFMDCLDKIAMLAIHRGADDYAALRIAEREAALASESSDSPLRLQYGQSYRGNEDPGQNVEEYGDEEEQTYHENEGPLEDEQQYGYGEGHSYNEGEDQEDSGEQYSYDQDSAAQGDDLLNDTGDSLQRDINYYVSQDSQTIIGGFIFKDVCTQTRSKRLRSSGTSTTVQQVRSVGTSTRTERRRDAASSPIKFEAMEPESDPVVQHTDEKKGESTHHSERVRVAESKKKSIARPSHLSVSARTSSEHSLSGSPAAEKERHLLKPDSSPAQEKKRIEPKTTTRSSKRTDPRLLYGAHHQSDRDSSKSGTVQDSTKNLKEERSEKAKPVITSPTARYRLIPLETPTLRKRRLEEFIDEKEIGTLGVDKSCDDLDISAEQSAGSGRHVAKSASVDHPTDLHSPKLDVEKGHRQTSEPPAKRLKLIPLSRQPCYLKVPRFGDDDATTELPTSSCYAQSVTDANGEAVKAKVQSVHCDVVAEPETSDKARNGVASVATQSMELDVKVELCVSPGSGMPETAYCNAETSDLVPQVNYCNFAVSRSAVINENEDNNKVTPKMPVYKMELLTMPSASKEEFESDDEAEHVDESPERAADAPKHLSDVTLLTAADSQHFTDAALPAFDAAQPVVNATKLGVDAIEPAADTTEPPTDAASPTTDAAELDTDAAGPDPDAAEPPTDAAESATDASKLTTDASEQGTDAAEPAAGAGEPSTDTTDPVTDAAEPAFDASKQGADAVEPAAGAGEPSTDTADPVTDAAERAPDTPANDGLEAVKEDALLVAVAGSTTAVVNDPNLGFSEGSVSLGCASQLKTVTEVQQQELQGSCPSSETKNPNWSLNDFVLVDSVSPSPSPSPSLSNLISSFDLELADVSDDAEEYIGTYSASCINSDPLEGEGVSASQQISSERTPISYVYNTRTKESSEAVEPKRWKKCKPGSEGSWSKNETKSAAEQNRSGKGKQSKQAKCDDRSASAGESRASSSRQNRPPSVGRPGATTRSSFKQQAVSSRGRRNSQKR